MMACLAWHRPVRNFSASWIVQIDFYARLACAKELALKFTVTKGFELFGRQLLSREPI